MTELEITEVSPERYRLKGELDMASAGRLRDALQPIVDAGGNITLDVADLTFIDSSGLRALILLSQRMNGAGPLVLSEVPVGVRRLLDIVGLESLPEIEVEASG